MTPSIGRIVHVLVDPKENNGSDVASAQITAVWGQPDPSCWTVNYRITKDGVGDLPWATSAYLYADEEAARAAEGAPNMRAFWPPRV